MTRIVDDGAAGVCEETMAGRRRGSAVAAAAIVVADGGWREESELVSPGLLRDVGVAMVAVKGRYGTLLRHGRWRSMSVSRVQFVFRGAEEEEEEEGK